MTHSTVRGRGADIHDTLSYVSKAVEVFFYEHGRLPRNYNEIRGTTDRFVEAIAPGSGLTYTWKTVAFSDSWRSHLPGANRLDPRLQDVRFCAIDARTGKELMEREYPTFLAARGAAWRVVDTFVEPHKSAVIDDPINIACALAEAVVEKHDSGGRWPGLADLPWQEDPVLSDIRGRPSTASFAYRVRGEGVSQRLVFSSAQTNELYIFDPKGLATAKAPEIVPKKP